MIEFVTGEVITNGKGTFSIYAFYRRDASHKEQPMHEAEKDDRSGIPRTERIVESTPSGHPIHKKSWTTRRHTFPNGAILKFVMKRTEPNGGAFARAKMSAMILVARDNAPLNLIEITLPNDQNSSKSKLYINGRFDVLTAEQVEERDLYINATGSDEMHLFESFEDDDTVTVTEQEKAIAPKPVGKVRKISPTKSMPKLRRTRRVGLVE